jgi:hypothetical protein
MRGYVLDYHSPLESETDPTSPRRPRRRGVCQTLMVAQHAAGEETRRDDRILGTWRSSELLVRAPCREADAVEPGGAQSARATRSRSPRCPLRCPRSRST